MKKILSITGVVFAITLIGFASRTAQAQMMGWYYDQGATSQASSSEMDASESAGYAIAQKIESKSLSCSDLSQGDYESLGEYYMGLMMGSGHESMDAYIVNRYGQNYDDQMHLAMGERISGCNVHVQFPDGMMGFGPMMGGFSRGYGMMGNYGNFPGYRMMGWNYGLGSGWGNMIFSIVLSVLALVGLVAVIKWALRSSKK